MVYLHLGVPISTGILGPTVTSYAHGMNGGLRSTGPFRTTDPQYSALEKFPGLRENDLDVSFYISAVSHSYRGEKLRVTTSIK